MGTDKSKTETQRRGTSALTRLLGGSDFFNEIEDLQRMKATMLEVIFEHVGADPKKHILILPESMEEMLGNYPGAIYYNDLCEGRPIIMNREKFEEATGMFSPEIN